MVRICENAVLLYCSAGHHFRACSWMLGLRLRFKSPFSVFLRSVAVQTSPWRKQKRFLGIGKVRLFLTDGVGLLRVSPWCAVRAERCCAKETIGSREGHNPRALRMEERLLGYRGKWCKWSVNMRARICVSFRCKQHAHVGQYRMVALLCYGRQNGTINKQNKKTPPKDKDGITRGAKEEEKKKKGERESRSSNNNDTKNKNKNPK